jgi:4-coumarate--CoA ligase
MVVMYSHFDLQKFLEGIQQFKVTLFGVAPPIALVLAKHPLVDEYDLSSIKSVVCGAAPLSKEIQDTVSKRLQILIRQAYGMTETAACML